MSDYESYEREPRPNRRRRRHGSAGWIIFFIIAAAVAWLVVGKQPMSKTSGAGARDGPGRPGGAGDGGGLSHRGGQPAALAVGLDARREDAVLHKTLDPAARRDQ